MGGFNHPEAGGGDRADSFPRLIEEAQAGHGRRTCRGHQASPGVGPPGLATQASPCTRSSRWAPPNRRAYRGTCGSSSPAPCP